MIIHTKIQKWGNGLALRVGGVMRDIPHFEAETEVEVEIFEDGFSVRKKMPQTIKAFPFSESQLLNGMTQELAHADLLAKPLSSELE